jgi:hypothetical protein
VSNALHLISKFPYTMKRRFNVKPSKRQQDDWTIRKAVLRGDFRRVKKLPETVDLREDWWKPFNQHETGSCVGCSLGDGVLRWHYHEQKLIDRNERPSIRFIWMASKEMDEFGDTPTTFIDDAGTSLKTALDVIRKHGCVKENVLPFNSAKLYTKAEDDFFTLAAKMKIRSYYNLTKSVTKKKKIELFRLWLASGGGPIFTCLDVDRSWNNADNTNGVLKKYYPNKREEGHAVCIVGYTPDGFIIRNSWGSNWGHNGFAYASNEYTMDAFKEAYGVGM